MTAIDAGFVHALADVRDAHHAAALSWQDSIGEGWVTTWRQARGGVREMRCFARLGNVFGYNLGNKY